jgi:S-(hydroxymethyl)glutathione dehydrogenase/alcohol dehydrogenase
MVSAHPIIAYDRYTNRLELAQRLGATHVVSGGFDDVDVQVRRIVGRGGADVVVEHTGDVGLIRLAYDLTQPQGRTILVGVPHRDQSATIPTLPLHFGKVLTGSYGGSAMPERDIPRYLRLHAAGKLRLEELITDRLPLAQINDAIDGMRSGRIAGRCLLRVCG